MAISRKLVSLAAKRQKGAKCAASGCESVYDIAVLDRKMMNSDVMPLSASGEDCIERLHVAVLAIKSSGQGAPRTVKLAREGVAKMAKKLVEEAAEVGLDAVQGDRTQVIYESADLLYHLTVLWAEAGIAPGDVWAEMERRERLYGIAEKIAKSPNQA
ncbi:phosphoribosyl-ATP diphosphatase [Chelatococcus sp. GCM10030263]|uniref:phosphoribosyl-ATP diphosphatase n=1 Tax=Chelatococcus sp. GCM10030263 TaxID=3273387 RepID=UPI00360AF75F